MDSCPSHIAITERSTPCCKRFIAVLWRRTCGDTRLVFSDGHFARAFSTCRVRMYWTPSRLKGWPRAFLNRGSAGWTLRSRSRTGWVLLDSCFVSEEGGRCRSGPLVGAVASGFQRCHVPVHKDNILAGFGRARVKLIVIEKERGRSRRKRQDEIGNSAGPVPLSQ